MLITINEARILGVNALSKLGFSNREQNLIVEHLLDAEMRGRGNHGFVKIPRLKSIIESGELKIGDEEPVVVREKPVLLHVDGRMHAALTVIPWMIERGIKKAKASGICIVGTENITGPSGCIGNFANTIASENLISIGFNSSPAGLTPFGSRDKVFGTNPLTIGIPTDDPRLPIVFDIASAKMTWADVVAHRVLGKALPEGVSVDKDGNPTTDPEAASLGGQVPFEQHKGSGLAFVIEILAGPLIKTVRHGWGSFFVIIDPEMIQPISEFKSGVREVIDDLKNSRKQEGVTEIFYPGERSGKLYIENLKRGEIEISEALIREIKSLK